MKEEPKQEIKLEDIFNDEKRQGVKELIDKHKQDDENYLDSFGVTKTQFEVFRNFNKQKTLEEASWKFNPLKKLDGEFLRHAFKEGAKWQQRNSYSEEDMQEYAEFCIICYVEELPCIIAKDWFEQFKNK